MEDALKEPQQEIDKVMAKLGDNESRLEVVAAVAHDFLLDYFSERATTGVRNGESP